MQIKNGEKGTMSENIFKFWRAVEALTPHEADPISKNAGAGSERVLEIGTGKGKDFPWRVPARLRRPPAGKAWRYTLQTVVFDANELMDRVEEELVKGRPVSGPVGSDRPAAGGEGVHCAEETEADFDDTAKNERRARMSRLFDLEFDQDGLPVVSSFDLSLCGWAAGVILKHGLAALDHPATCAVETSRRLSPQRGRSARPQTGFSGFDSLLQVLEDELDERAAALRDENGNIVKTVDLSWLEDFAAFVVGKCGLTQEESFQGPWEHRLKCVQVKAKEVKNGNGGKEEQGEEQRDDSLMNSFFTADLSKLAAAEPATLGAGLQAFMAAAPPAAGERKDIRTDDGRSHTAALLLPARHPAGRWPADHPLVYSQQTAVNALWEKLQDRTGIMAVNGPPGTGKTTLLRDIVAAVVVERARELSKLPRPKDAFAARKMETPEGNTIYFHPFRDTVSSKLEDFTIVVASSNNKAVENVSLELPRQSAVGTRWRQEAEGVDYFRALATALGRGRDGGETAVDERGNDNLMGPVRTGGDSGAHRSQNLLGRHIRSTRR